MEFADILFRKYILSIIITLLGDAMERILKPLTLIWILLGPLVKRQAERRRFPSTSTAPKRHKSSHGTFVAASDTARS